MIYTTLYVWTVVAATIPTTYVQPNKIYEWRANGSFYSAKACHEAARQLNIKEYRCIDQSTGGKQ